MSRLDLSPKFALFLEDYAKKVGKEPSQIVEEAVSQAILRHEAGEGAGAHGAVVMPNAMQARLLAALPEFTGRVADSLFGEFMEHLPDHKWTYQACRLEDWWFLVVSKDARPLAEPLEVRSTETSQAYAWLFGFAKSVKLWSAPDRFLVVF